MAYCIVGNFCGVKIFADFADSLVSVKIKTMGMVTSCKKVSHMHELRQSRARKFKLRKYLLKDYGAIPRKFAPIKISC